MGNFKQKAAALAAAAVMSVSCLPVGGHASTSPVSDSSVGSPSGHTAASSGSTGSKTASSSSAKKLTTSSLAQVQNVKATNVTTKGYTISWNKVTGADGYRVYIVSGGKAKLLKTFTGNALKVNVNPGAKHTFVIAPVKKTASGLAEGPSVQKVFTSKPAKISQFVYQHVKRGSLTFKWSAVPRTTKYQIYYSTQKNSGYKLFKEVAGTKNSVSTALMPKGKTLYFTIRAVSKAKDNTAAGVCADPICATVFNALNVNTIMSRYKPSKSVTQINAQGFKLSANNKQRLYNVLTYMGGDAGYILYDIDSGSAVAYNANQYFMPASSVKAPFMMYCLRCMDSGKYDLETKVTYQPSQQHGGTGIIQNSAYYTTYTVRQLFKYIADYSDNVAYYMLQDQFDINGYNKYIKSLGCRTSLVKGGDRWGVVSACDGAREWNDIWNYLRSGKQAKFARQIYSSTIAANIRIALGNKYKVYEKSGWTDGSYGYHHETGLVRAEHPYIIICLTNRSSAPRMQEMAKISDDIHQEMWKHYK